MLYVDVESDSVGCYGLCAALNCAEKHTTGNLHIKVHMPQRLMAVDTNGGYGCASIVDLRSLLVTFAVQEIVSESQNIISLTLSEFSRSRSQRSANDVHNDVPTLS